MSLEDEWVFLLESHPGLAKFSKSRIFMTILHEISKSAYSVESLYFKFPHMEVRDLEEILEAFVDTSLATKTLIGEKFIYRASDKARDFLKAYKKVEKQFTV
ncbi:MAG: hypothetical protein JW772_02200 [Candidatus Diapherotrites archaeon]|nr:hypothetical protein [Candidatus Diapherotrites archaeon]